MKTILHILIMSLFFFLISCKSNDFIYLIFTDVFGLKEDASLSFRGIKIGTVKSIKIENTKYIITKCLIEKKIPIPNDSKFVIESTSIMGDKLISFHLGESKTNIEIMIL